MIKDKGYDINELTKQLQSAIFMRLMLVNNILKFDENDFALTIGLISHFLSKPNVNESPSKFIINRFTNI